MTCEFVKASSLIRATAPRSMGDCACARAVTSVINATTGGRFFMAPFDSLAGRRGRRRRRPLVLLEPVSRIELRPNEVGRPRRRAVPLFVEANHRGRHLAHL